MRSMGRRDERRIAHQRKGALLRRKQTRIMRIVEPELPQSSAWSRAYDAARNAGHLNDAVTSMVQWRQERSCRPRSEAQSAPVEKLVKREVLPQCSSIP